MIKTGRSPGAFGSNPSGRALCPALGTRYAPGLFGSLTLRGPCPCDMASTVAGLIVLMVVVGGITRLPNRGSRSPNESRSAASIPPLTTRRAGEFAHYKRIPNIPRSTAA